MFERELPDDMSEAVEMLKLAIIRHKAAGWREVALDDVLDTLRDLRVLACGNDLVECHGREWTNEAEVTGLAAIDEHQDRVTLSVSECCDPGVSEMSDPGGRCEFWPMDVGLKAGQASLRGRYQLTLREVCQPPG